MTNYVWNSEKHKYDMRNYRNELLNFYQPTVVNPNGGFYWLDSTGNSLPEYGTQLWLSARMIHCFSLAHLDGRPGAKEIAEQGIDFYYRGPGRDVENGGWYAKVINGTGEGDKDLYGLAHILLASSTACQAGINNSSKLLSNALDILANRYWEYDYGLALDSYDMHFNNASSYRGINANMHLTEALLAAYSATQDTSLLTKAIGIAYRLVGEPVSKGNYRLVEHYDSHWNPLPDFNIDKPNDPFKPYGSTPGHWLEWAKLCLQIYGLDSTQTWSLPTAESLFKAADEAWMPGYVYTVDWQGFPVCSYRFWWPITEAIGTAHFLSQITNESQYKEAYEHLWNFAHQYFIDHDYGVWFYELDDNLHPVSRTWFGKPDLYHVYQAALYCDVSYKDGFAQGLINKSNF